MLIDIIGTYNGGSANFGKDLTLRRKSGVSQPNINFDIANEWDVLDKDNASDFGSHSAIVLSTESYTMQQIAVYPNPTENILHIRNSGAKTIKEIILYNLLGKKIITLQNPDSSIDVSFLSKGIYLITFSLENQTTTLKFIKK